MSRAPWHRRNEPGIVRAANAVKWATLALGLGLLAAAGCQSCAHGATLTISGTAPAHDNAGTCALPSLTPSPAGSLVTVFVQVTGPAVWSDSLVVAAGSPFTFTRTVPAGTYTVRAWASDAGGAGCDTTITRTVKNPPGRVRL